jgi:hypothetical protein
METRSNSYSIFVGKPCGRRWTDKFSWKSDKMDLCVISYKWEK